MSKNRTSPNKGWVQASALPKGENGRALCRQCEKEVPKGRYTFCSAKCVHEWKVRSSPQYVRQCLRKRDKGVCALCKLDTYALSKGLRRPLADESWEAWTLRVKKIREEYKIPAHRVTLWDADHKISVVEGGGETGLDNFQTLCWRCHQEKTSKLVTKLAADRASKKSSTEKPSRKKKPNS